MELYSQVPASSDFLSFIEAEPDGQDSKPEGQGSKWRNDCVDMFQFTLKKLIVKYT